MNIINKILAIRDSLPPMAENEIDFNLAPVPPFITQSYLVVIQLYYYQ